MTVVWSDRLSTDSGFLFTNVSLVNGKLSEWSDTETWLCVELLCESSVLKQTPKHVFLRNCHLMLGHSYLESMNNKLAFVQVWDANRSTSASKILTKCTNALLWSTLLVLPCTCSVYLPECWTFQLRELSWYSVCFELPNSVFPFRLYIEPLLRILGRHSWRPSRFKCTRVIQKLLQCRQYRDKKGIPSQTDYFASSNYSSCICTSNYNKSDLDRKYIKSSFLSIT